MREEVRNGYEQGEYFSVYRSDHEFTGAEKRFLEAFSTRADGTVLDIGCGPGVPFDEWLVAQGFELTGIDISNKHVRLAREHVPEATFITDDFSTHEFEQQFDNIISLYALFHLPKEEHADLFAKISDLTKPGGYVLLTLGGEEMDAEGEFIGSKMRWSSHSPQDSLDLLADAGIEVLQTLDDTEYEHHFWVLGRNS